MILLNQLQTGKNNNMEKLIAYKLMKNKLCVFFENEGYNFSIDIDGIEMSMVKDFGKIMSGFQIVKSVSQKEENYLTVGIRVNDFVFNIRHDIVEDICYKFNNNFDENTLPHNGITIGSSYGKVTGKKYFSIGEAYTEEEVENICNLIKSIYTNNLKSCIERYSNLKLLERDFNMDTENELPFSPIYWRGRRSMRGLILAKLCNNPRYEELKIIYRQKCIEQEDADVLEAYDKLAYYLDHEFEKT